MIGYQDEMRYLSGSLYLWSLPTLEAMTRTYVPDQSIFQAEPLFDSLYGQIQNFRCVSWRSCKSLYNILLMKVNNWNILFQGQILQYPTSAYCQCQGSKGLAWVGWICVSDDFKVWCDVCLLESILEMCSSSGLLNLSEPALLQQAPRTFARDQDLILQVDFKSYHRFLY